MWVNGWENRAGRRWRSFWLRSGPGSGTAVSDGHIGLGDAHLGVVWVWDGGHLGWRAHGDVVACRAGQTTATGHVLRAKCKKPPKPRGSRCSEYLCGFFADQINLMQFQNTMY